METQNTSNTYTPNIPGPPPSQIPTPGTPIITSGSTVHSKKGIPKVVIFIILVLLLGVAAFAAFKFFSGSDGKIAGTITWWGLWEDPSIVQPLIDAYESSHEGVEINYVKQSPQDYRERLTSALAEGKGPDIFAYHNSWVPMFKANLSALPASVINPADYAKTFYPIATSDLTNGSSIVGIPLEYDGLVLYVNTTMFEKAGKPVPTTWDDFRSTAKSLTVKDDQGVITQAGAAMGRTENVDHWPEIIALLMLQNGVDLGKPVGKTAEDALTFFAIFSTNDGVWDAALPASTQAFAAGKLAMYIAPSWRAFEIIQQNPNLSFKTFPMPQLPKDSPTQPDITYATYWAQGVSSASQNTVTSWDFLKYLSGQEALANFYQSATKFRNFGEPYPRVDMAGLMKDHPLAGAVVQQAPGAVSWYLASRTFDGPTGINSLMNKYFEDAINATLEGTAQMDKIMPALSQGVSQVLAQYKLIAR